jgi:hypothetical protein
MITIEELRDKIINNNRYKDNITKTRISKNGLFIYGGYYKTSSGEQHPIYTYISKLELKHLEENKSFIIDLLETFIDEVERLREAI